MLPPADLEQGADWDAARVKRRAMALGADLVGIASAETLNAFPPDPRWPQTPDRISPYCKSVIVVAKPHPGRRIPLQVERAGAVPRHAGPAEDGPARVPAVGGAGARRSPDLRHRGAGDGVDAEARELRPAFDAAPGRRGGARHARARGQHPHARVRPARLPHRHPHRARARARPARSPSRSASANRAAAACTPARPTRCCTGASTSASARPKRRSSASRRS